MRGSYTCVIPPSRGRATAADETSAGVNARPGRDPTWSDDWTMVPVAWLKVGRRAAHLTMVETLDAAVLPAASLLLGPSGSMSSHCRQRALLVFSLALLTIALIAYAPVCRRTYKTILDSVQPQGDIR
jgi:hypothetical protein